MITLVLILSPIFPKIYYNMDELLNSRKENYTKILRELYRDIRRDDTEKINNFKFLLKNDKNVLFMLGAGDVFVDNINESPENYIPKNYLYNEFKVLNYLNFKLWYSVRDIIIEDSKVNLLIDTVIIILIISIVVFI
jgi:hypothetical protein